MIDPNSFKPGQVYSWIDIDDKILEIYIVGQDPRTGKWVASSIDWCMEYCDIDKDDYLRMTLLKESSNHPNGSPKWAKDGTLLDENGNRSIFDDVDE